MTPIETVVQKLADLALRPKQSGGGWQARCPAHEDRKPSLSLHESPTGAALIYCHAGCTTPAVVDALGLTFRDLFPEKERTTPHRVGLDKIYPYHDPDGTLIYEVVRYQPKDFRQRQPDGHGGHVWNLQNVTRVLYHLPQVVRAVNDGTTIWICEGEKDVENAQWWTAQHDATIVATSKSGGACARPDQWLDSYTQTLEGAARVVIVADNDDTGRRHAGIVHDALAGHVKDLRIVLPADGCKDLSDHIAHAHTLDELRPVGRTDLDPEIPEPETETAAVEPSDLRNLLIDWQTFWAHDRSDEQWVAYPLFASSRGHALYAPAKAGKSSVILAVAAAIATGQSLFGYPPSPPRNVLYVDYEMTEADLQERLAELGYGPASDLTRLSYALLPAIAPLDTEDGARDLCELAAMVDAELVIVDTFGRAVAGDENDADVVRTFYRLVGQQLKAAGRAWVRTDHAGKDVDKGQRGSSAKNDDVDVVWRLTRTDNGVRLLRTHARMAWVPDKVVVGRSEKNGIVTWLMGHDSFSDEAKALAKELDALDVPLNWGRRRIRNHYGEKIEGANKTLDAAIAYRKRVQNGSVVDRGPLENLVGGPTTGTSDDDSQNPTSTSRSTPGTRPVTVPSATAVHPASLVEGRSDRRTHSGPPADKII